MTATNNPLLGRIARRAAQVRPANAVTFEVKENQFLQITDMIGKQTANVIVFNLHDFGERLSTSQTRSANNALMLRKEDGIFSNRRSRMFTVIEDTVGRHDMLLPACDARRYLDDYGIAGHGNCHDNFVRALAEKEYAVPEDALPDPISFFMHVGVKSRGELEIREPLSGRNDNVVLKAHMDTLVVVSACPNDQNAANGFNPTDILVRVYA
jgi:uncharacterized protein YcgI (DUF1989 family)